MEIYTTMEPHELAENIANEREATSICSEILRQWNHLPQKMYEEILEEIPDYAITQYQRKMRRLEREHCERLSDLLKKRQLHNERE